MRRLPLLTLLLLLGALGGLQAQQLVPRTFTPNNRVFDLGRKGDTLYAVGSFTWVGVETGGAGWITDSLPLVNFPVIDGTVRAVIPDGQGGWYVAGDFDQAGSLACENLVHIFPGGDVDPNFVPSFNNEILAMVSYNDTMFVGGRFTQAAGQARSRLAAFDLATGQLLAWDPSPNGNVNALAVVDGGLYVGGTFQQVAGRYQPGLARLHRSTGALLASMSPTIGGINTFEVAGNLLYTGGGFQGLTGRFTGRAAAFGGLDDAPKLDFPRFQGTVRVIEEDGNGGWYVGGDFFQVDGQSFARLVHILPNGTVDPAFLPAAGGSVYDLLRFNDTMLVAGTFLTMGGQPRRRLAAIDATTGALLAWNPDADNTVTSLATNGTHILAGGSFTSIGGRQQRGLAVLDKLTGLPLQTPGLTNGQVNSLAWNDTMLYAGGSFTGATGFAASRLALISDTDIRPAHQFPAFGGAVYASVPDGSGGWYVGGGFFTVDGNVLRRLAHILPDSTLDPAFDFNINGTVYDLAIFNDTMLVAGAFTDIDGNTRERLAAIDLSTNTLLSWNPSVSSDVNSILKQGNTLFLGGNFTTVNGQTRNRAAALNIPSASLLPWDPDFNNEVNQLIFNDTMLVVLGRFTTAGGQPRNRAAMVGQAGATLVSWDPNANNEVKRGVIVGNTLYLGGSFTQMGGQSRSRLAAVDLTLGALQAWNPGANSTIEVLATQGNVLYAGGNFTQIGGQDHTYLASFDLPGGGLRAWTPNPSAVVYSIVPQGGSLMIGGNFQALGSQARTRLMALGGTNWALDAWAPNLNGTVNDLIMPDDTMFIAGAFTQVDGLARGRLAAFNLGSNQLLPWDPGADGTVETIFRFNDTMLVAGAFGQLAGQNRAHLGALSISGGQALAWNPDPNDDVLTVARSGGTVVAGGSFDAYQARSRNRLFCYDMTGDSLTPWNPGIQGFVGAPRANTLAVTPAGVWVGGAFATIGDSARQNLALTDPLTGQVLPAQAPADGEVFALLARGDSLWVGGRFDTLQGQVRRKAALLTGGQLDAFAPEANGFTYTFGFNDTMLVAGGSFTHLIGRERKGGYAVDTKTGRLTAWNPNIGQNSFINALAIDPKNGHVYLGGSFDEVHGQARDRLARVDMAQGLPDTWQNDANGLINALAWDAAQGELYVGGSFTQLGGQARSYLGRIGAGGQVDAFDPAPDGTVTNIAYNDTMLWTSGTFGNIGGQVRGGLAALRRNGQPTAWQPAVTGLGGFPASVGAIDVTADRIYIGGNFRNINGAARDRLAAFDRATGDLLPWQAPIDSGIDASFIQIGEIKARDQQLFVSGVFNEVHGTLTGQLAWIDAKSGLVQGLRAQVGNSVLALEVMDSLVYVAGDFSEVEGSYQPNLASYDMVAPLFQGPDITLKPRLGGNTGDVTVQIFGSGFTTHPKVILRKAGLPDIGAIDSLTRVFFGDQVRVTFDLRQAPLGLRDVWIIANGDTTILPDGFRVVQGQEPRVWAKIVSPRRIRFNPTSPGHRLMVSYGNAGSIDAEGVPIWLALSSHVNLVDIQLEFLPYPGNLTPGDVLPFVPVDTLNGREVDVVVYAMVIGRVPAGFQGQIGFRVRPDTLGNFFAAAWATKPLYGSPLKYAVGECTDALIGKIVGLVPGGDCVYNAMDALLSPIFDAALDPDFGSAQYAANYAWTLGGAIVDCGIAATGGGLVLDILKDILNYKALYDDFQTILACLEQFGPDPEEDEIRITASADPNQKAGLPGVGAPQWINPIEPLPYLVEFENLPTATAPAIEVRIEDTLDVQVMDLRTFELRFFTLADSLFEIPPGRQEWKQMVDLRPTGNDAFARVSFELDTLSGVLISRFEGLDPATLEPLDGALEGIIPPNVNDPEGRGSIGYRVDLLPGLPTGTPVANSAAIYFDFNAPIVTNTWLNTLDVDAPESAVLPLDSVQFSLDFPVRWSGTDLGSGVEKYDLYVSTDGGGFVREIPNISDTAITFTGEAGRSYAFYTVAIDSVGNAEMAPLVADAETRIDGATSVETRPEATLTIAPNPNRGAFDLRVEGLPAGLATLRIFDATGRQVAQQALPLSGGAQAIPVQLSLPAGMYLLGVQAGSRYWHQRLVIE